MLNSHDLIESYARGPEELAQTLQGLSAEALRARPVPGKWSIHEVVCHLADFDLINAERIKRIIAEERPTFFNAEPDPFAARLAYDQRNTQHELELISTVRRHVVVILRSLGEADWNREGVHSIDGPLTLVALVQRATKHFPHHLRFIQEKRAALKSPR